MNLLDLMVKIGVDDQASGRIGGIADGIGGKLAGAAKVGAAAVAAVGVAAAGATAAVGKQALDAYASYEQLSGGVEKLFGPESAQIVMDNAQKAFQTAGMSANQYMEQATSFSAAMINSLGGDTQKAAEMTDVAMRAMSDNVNVFGSNMGDVQNAFQGFAKQNYTMLDNLKLGYGGTKEEMQRLIDDANAYAEANGKAADLSIDSFADIVQAIQYIQEEQNIAGTTAKEAATTIEGSLAMVKGAWDNLLAEFGKDDGDVGARMTELVDSAKTALFGTLDEQSGEMVGGIIPRVQVIVQSIADAMPDIIPLVTQAVADLAPEFVSAGIAIGQAIFDGIGQALMEAFPQIGEFLDSDAFAGISEAWAPFVDNLRAIGEEVLPLVQPALQLLADTAAEYILPAIQRLGEAANYFLEQLQPWVPYIVNVATIIGQVLIIAIAALIDILAAGANIWGTILQAGMAFANFLQNLPATVQGAFEQVGAFFDNLWQTASGAVENMRQAVGQKIEEVKQFFVDLPGNIWNALSNLGTDMWNMGVDIVQGLINGIWANIGAVGDTLMSGLQGAVDSAKSFLGIASPSKLFEWIGEMSMEGLGNGYDRNMPDLPGMLSEMTSPLMSGDGLAFAGAAVQAAPSIAIYIDGARVNDDERVSSLFRDFMYELTRNGGM